MSERNVQWLAAIRFLLAFVAVYLVVLAVTREAMRSRDVTPRVYFVTPAAAVDGILGELAGTMFTSSDSGVRLPALDTFSTVLQ